MMRWFKAVDGKVGGLSSLTLPRVACPEVPKAEACPCRQGPSEG